MMAARTAGGKGERKEQKKKGWHSERRVRVRRTRESNARLFGTVLGIPPVRCDKPVARSLEPVVSRTLMAHPPSDRVGTLIKRCAYRLAAQRLRRALNTAAIGAVSRGREVNETEPMVAASSVRWPADRQTWPVGSTW